MKLFLTSSASHLQRSLKKHGFDLGQVESYAFADGECGYRLRDRVEEESVGILGSVRGKEVVLLDDIIDTGRTMAEAIKLVFQEGARKVRLAATHGIFSGDARKRLSRFPVDEILVTNTLP